MLESLGFSFRVCRSHKLRQVIDVRGGGGEEGVGEGRVVRGERVDSQGRRWALRAPPSRRSGQHWPGCEEGGGAWHCLQGDTDRGEGRHVGGEVGGAGREREGGAGLHWGLQGRGWDVGLSRIWQGTDAAPQWLAQHGLEMALHGENHR